MSKNHNCNGCNNNKPNLGEMVMGTMMATLDNKQTIGEVASKCGQIFRSHRKSITILAALTGASIGASIWAHKRIKKLENKIDKLENEVVRVVDIDAENVTEG